jgi:hypothetical protein
VNWTFAHADYFPYLGVVLLVGGYLLYRVFLALRQAREGWGEPRLVNRFHPLNIKMAMLNASCWMGILVLMWIAIMQPFAPDAPDTVRSGTMNIVNVYDVSWSIQVEDYRGKMPGSEPGSTVATGASGSRLHMARHLTEQIMRTTSGNQMGLVTYMGSGWRIFPTMTDDYAGLRFIMDISLKPGNAPGGGSDVTKGLVEGITLLDEAEKKAGGNSGRQKVIMLYSDGGFTGNREELGKAIEALKAKNIRLIIIGLGDSAELPVPVYNEQTGTFVSYRKLKEGETTSIDERFLEKLANDTGGQYYGVPPGQTTVSVQWATALGGATEQPQGKPMYKWCIFGIFALLIIISLPGFQRKRNEA